jgi:hypothetical protein
MSYDPPIEEHKKILIDLNQDPQLFITTFYRFTADGIETRYLSNDLCCFLSSPREEQQECPMTLLSSEPMGANGNVYHLLIDGETEHALKTTALSRLTMEYRTVVPDVIKRLEASIAVRDRTDAQCGLKDLDSIYVGCDKFSIETLMAILVQYLMSDFPVQSYISYQGASLCQDKIAPVRPDAPAYTGIHLMEYADLGRLDHFNRSIGDGIYHQWERKTLVDSSEELIDVVKPSVLMEIMKQLILTFFHLSIRAGFTHRHLIVSKILLSSQPAEGLYFSIPMNLPFTVKISDFDKVGLSLPLGPEEKIHRFYNRHPITDVYLNIPRPPYKFITGRDIDQGKSKEYYVLPQYFKASNYERIRMMGVPFYPQFDLYTLLVSLMMTPSFYYSIIGQPQLEALWSSLWFPKDLQMINQRLRLFIGKEKPPTMDHVIEFLTNTRLKCDPLSDLIDLLI